MATAEDIAAQYDLTPSGNSYTGECPSCCYRGFTVTDKDGRTLFYCHGGGCTQVEIINVLRDAGLWGQSVTDLFGVVDLAPAAAARPEHGGDNKKAEYAVEMWRRSQPAEGT